MREFDGNRFANRLQEIANKYRSTREFALAAGLEPSSMRQYLKEGSIPRLDKAAAIAETAGISLDHLAFGKAGVDNDEIRPLVYNIAYFLAKHSDQISFDPAQFAEAFVDILNHLQNDQKSTPESIVSFEVARLRKRSSD